MKRDTGKEKFWRQAIVDAESSGQTARGFCQCRGLNENLFYSWRRELRVRDAERKENSGFVELVTAVGASGGAGVSVRIDERISIVLERGFDGNTLNAALAVLASVDAR